MAPASTRLRPTELARDLDGSFADLVREYQDGIYSGVYRLVPTHADAEDVTQETFVRAYRALRGYDPDRIEALKLGPWLWTIALNLCRNAARRRTRKPDGPGLDRVVEPADRSDTEAAAIAAVASDEWQRRLASLPPRMRAAVVLRHVVDMDYPGIAEATGRPVGTVKSDVHRGLQRLQASLLNEAALVAEQEKRP